MLAGGRCGRRQQWGCADANPGLEMARAGLEHYTGIMPVGAHAVDDRLVGVIQINQNKAGVAILGIREKVDVASLAVANSQKPYGCRMGQLGSRPKPFSWEGPFSGAVNQTEQIEVMRHRRELAADRLHSEKESAVDHGHNSAIDLDCRVSRTRLRQ